MTIAMRSLLRTACVAAVAAFAAASAAGASAQAAQANAGAGVDSSACETGAGRETLTIIDTLSRETLDQSFEMAGFAKDYFDPGYMDPGFGDRPTPPLHTLMANRRFSKLYGDLSVLSADEQYAYLSRYFDVYLGTEKGITSKFRKGTPLVPDDYGVLSVIPNKPTDPPSQHGTRQALRAIAILSGMLGNARMWPALKVALENPVTGLALDESQYDKAAMDHMKIEPVFNEGVRAEVAYLMAQNAGPQVTKMGLDAKAVLAAVPAGAVRKVELFKYTTRVTPYDFFERTGGAPVDMSHGWYDIRMLMTDDKKIVNDVILGAGLKLVPLPVPVMPTPAAAPAPK